jgi:hypothetical protein
MDFVPKFKSGTKTISTQVKLISINNVDNTKVIICTLNSSLFYWFFIATSDCRHLNLREIENFGLDINKMSKENIYKLVRLCKELMESYQRHSKIKKTTYQASGHVEYQEFFPKKSKHIIDKIDDVLADHYDLSPEQKNFIKQFDEKFRMGEEEEDI